MKLANAKTKKTVLTAVLAATLVLQQPFGAVGMVYAGETGDYYHRKDQAAGMAYAGEKEGTAQEKLGSAGDSRDSHTAEASNETVTPAGTGNPGDRLAEEPSDDTLASVSAAAFGESLSTETSADILAPAGVGDVTKIHDPHTENGVSTWDCVWFGKYWQEDTNGDHYCFSRDTVVEKRSDGFYYDQDDKRIYGTIEEGSYKADKKQPIKWRVLDIDTDGNALLLADKAIDCATYNETNTDVTWKTSTMRSYLNGYGENENVCRKDFSGNSFAGEAFTAAEFNSIKNETVRNPENSVYNTSGGDNTVDRIFFLSIEEAMKSGYGFLANRFTEGSDISTVNYQTDSDLTRVVKNSLYMFYKPGVQPWGAIAPDLAYWMLRSPGSNSRGAACVSYDGRVIASTFCVNMNNYCVRPALRLNLKNHSDLWSNAGTVTSDGKGTEISPEDTGNLPKKPVTQNKVTTWDCVWFGRYWQNTDSNKDGKVTQDDEKDPVKWRVLDIDGDGNALLMSDKCLDLQVYESSLGSGSHSATYDVPWDGCTLRSFCNSYDGTHNSSQINYSEKGFLNNAFQSSEISAIKLSTVKNEKNKWYGTDGGPETTDRIFLLSTAEAATEGYGFVENDFNQNGDSCSTGADSTRQAGKTKYVEYREEGYSGIPCNPDCWWLRSPGNKNQSVTYVSYVSRTTGMIDGSAWGAGLKGVPECVRPALNINLKENPSVWSYAGTVVSDGSGKEIPLEPHTLSKPTTVDGISTWDCVYFGNYWQEDTNGDGYCCSEETIIQGEKRPADEKQRIKWRVLDIKEDGRVLLLSDKLLFTARYNDRETSTIVTWDRSTLRSYLNGYGTAENNLQKDYTGKGFIDDAFDDDETAAIEVSNVFADSNTVHNVSGGNDTEDKLFCLSMTQAREPLYGFIENEFGVEGAGRNYTKADPSRAALRTGYAALYYTSREGWWFLRTPGLALDQAACVNEYGAILAGGNSTNAEEPVRPALWINLYEHPELWTYAGRVKSDGTEEDPDDQTHATAVSLPDTLEIGVGENRTLIPVFTPEDAYDQTVTWNSDDTSVASISNKGVVTGLTIGETDITVTTNDGGHTAVCHVIVRNKVISVLPPSISNGVTTWSCVYFGNYWQNTDTDNDGHVTRKDKKDPIKWRILDIEDGYNALLMSDQLLDITEYNENDSSVTWEDSSLRTFLNSENEGFLKDAFDEEERAAIFISNNDNPVNPVYGAEGGNLTRDRVFCLSLSEAMTRKYGFARNSFTDPSYSPKKYLTGQDPTREAVTTRFIEDKEGYSGYISGTRADWWLRSPGYIRSYASRVCGDGVVNAQSFGADNKTVCVRPVIRLNLRSHPSLWKDAGNVSSDPVEDDPDNPPVPEEPEEEIKLESDGNLDIDMIPGEVRRLSVSTTSRYIYGIRWTVSSNRAGTVSVKNGVITAKKSGKAVVTAIYGTSEPLQFNITVNGNTPSIAKAVDGSKLKAKKSIKTVVGKPKTVVVTLPSILKGRHITPGVQRSGVCTVSQTGVNSKGNKVTFTITPVDAGATYIVWNVSDMSGHITQAYTKVIVKKPITDLAIGQSQPLKLKAGEGVRLVVTGTKGNTSTGNVNFKVSAPGVRVSRAGYVTATTPGSLVIVSASIGGIKKSIVVEVEEQGGNYLVINKSGVVLNIPKPLGYKKESRCNYYLSKPKRKVDRPVTTWKLAGDYPGMALENGRLTISKNALPGSYIIKAEAEGFTTAYSEVILR